jgi:hypothetical protein
MKRILMGAVATISLSACAGVSLGNDGWKIDNTASGGMTCTYNGPLTSCYQPVSATRQEAMRLGLFSPSDAQATDAELQAKIDAYKTAKQRAAEEAQARQAKLAADRQAEIALHNSPEYKARQAEHHISQCKAMIKTAKADLEHQREVGEESGFVNKSEMYEAGNWIVSCRHTIQNAWTVYRENGGKKSLAAIN